MWKQAVLYTSVVVTALAATAGCAGGDGTAPPPAATSAAESGATSERTTAAGRPGASGTRENRDRTLAGLGRNADWKKLVAACPDERQAEIIQKVVVADLTGDGVADAAVGRTCESITSYWPSTVEVFDGTSPPDRPRRVGTLLEDVGPTDKPWLTTLRVSGRQVTIEAVGTGEGDNACADLGFTYGYRYRGGTFTRVTRMVGDANECQRIG